MNEVKLRGAIGLCAKARKVECGSEAVKRAIENGRAVLVLIDTSASDATRQRIRSICGGYEIDCKEIPESVRLAEAVGRDTCKLFAITDENMARLVSATLG